MDEEWKSISIGMKYKVFAECCLLVGKYLEEEKLLKVIELKNIKVKPGVTALDGQDFFFVWKESYIEGSQKYWIISAGPSGSLLNDFKENNVIAINFHEELGDLRNYRSKEELRKKMIEIESLKDNGSSKMNDSLACWEFVNEIDKGDLVFIKSGAEKINGLVKVASDYYYDESREEYPHLRKVEWIDEKTIDISDNKINLVVKTLTNLTKYSEYVKELLQAIKEKQQKVWIEKTIISNRPTRKEGEKYGLGSYLWSPKESRDGKDIYSDMRELNKGDYVLHLIDNKEIVGISKVKNRFQEFTSNNELKNTEWGGLPCYKVKLEKFTRFEKPISIYGDLLENKKFKKTLKELNKNNSVFYTKDLKLAQGKYITKLPPELVSILSSISEELGRNLNLNTSVAKTEIMVDRYTLTDAIEDLFMEENDFQNILNALEYKKNIILQGPPGVGKSFIAKRLAYCHMGMKDPKKIRLVQFHQSYSYEDFIQGYRPTEDGGFILRNGTFYKMCKDAKEDPEHDYFMIIDEINRGNLSKILGELMLLIEADKRGKDFEVILPYSGEKFYIPENIFLIGTMNTADRSLAMVDYALRRRFSFISLRPAFNDNFRDYLDKFGISKERIEKIIEKIKGLNEEIERDNTRLGEGFLIGHSFFTPTKAVKDESEWYTSIVELEVKPLLQEYFFDDLERYDELQESLD
ncbi:AAA domain-containing protein [Candidatus Dojkabacteria bacterium]|nr:AAA domain-containing protein [Candidatus Dojkabacteria bacterium]